MVTSFGDRSRGSSSKIGRAPLFSVVVAPPSTYSFPWNDTGIGNDGERLQAGGAEADAVEEVDGEHAPADEVG